MDDVDEEVWSPGAHEAGGEDLVNLGDNGTDGEGVGKPSFTRSWKGIPQMHRSRHEEAGLL